MDPKHAIARPLLRDRVAEYLRNQIVQGSLEPGERLVESSIARELGTSQAPVREAVQSLVFDGLARMENHKGATVSDFSIEDMREVFLVRATIESLAVSRAIPRMDEPFLASLRGQVAELHAAAGRGDLDALVDADLAFHRAVIERSDHPLLLRLWDVTYFHTRRFILTVHPNHYRLEEMAAEHEPLLEAVIEGDRETAAASFANHMETVWERMGRPLGGTEPAS